MDGLLVDSERITLEACRFAGEICGVTITEDFYKSLIGKGEDDSEQAILKEFGRNFPLEKFKAHVDFKMQLLLKNQTIWKKGAREIVEFVHQQKIPMGLVTSSHHDDVNVRLKSLARRFAVTVAREDVALGKPAPDLYLKAILDLKIDPGEGIVFEDSPAGVEAALSAGLNVVIVPDMVEPAQKQVEKATGICKDLFEGLDLLKKILGNRRI